MKKYFWYLSVAVVVIVSACKQKKLIANAYTHKTECEGTELDGSQIVRAWANTVREIDAVEQAKKNAVNDVLFGGIIDGKPGCDVKPVLGGANVRENNEEYFNKFFSDNGDYKKYSALYDPVAQRQYYKSKEKTAKFLESGFVIKVFRSRLKQKMIDDGILK